MARGRGHRSWITAVAFDPMTSCLSSSGPATSNGPTLPAKLPTSKDPPVPGQRIITYRFATVGQDTQICLWELTDDIVKQSTYPRGRGGSLMINAPIPGLSGNLPDFISDLLLLLFLSSIFTKYYYLY